MLHRPAPTPPNLETSDPHQGDRSMLVLQYASAAIAVVAAVLLALR
jgi:hypothetical protein